ncbi:MAG: dolichyl-phosphate beta-glucosyltransferase [Pseudomonadota bacterium]
MILINIYLSIVIPAYNEAKRIAPTLGQIDEYLAKKDYKYEILVVDDGSTDETCKLVNEVAQQIPHIILLENRINRGKGYSVRKGVLSGRGEIILFSDADLSTPIQEIDKLAAWLDMGYDISIGSRALTGSEILEMQPWYRQAMGKTFNSLVQLLTVSGIKDTQCGFKLFKKEAAEFLFEKQVIDGFAFDVEILFLANKNGYRIKEVPVQWVNSPCSRVHIFKDSLAMFSDLIRIRIRYLIGKYGL